MLTYNLFKFAIRLAAHIILLTDKHTLNKPNHLQGRLDFKDMMRAARWRIWTVIGDCWTAFKSAVYSIYEMNVLEYEY